MPTFCFPIREAARVSKITTLWARSGLAADGRARVKANRGRRSWNQSVWRIGWQALAQRRPTTGEKFWKMARFSTAAGQRNGGNTNASNVSGAVAAALFAKRPLRDANHQAGCSLTQ